MKIWVGADHAGLELKNALVSHILLCIQFFEIPDEDAEKLRTVGDVASYLEKKGKA